MNLVSAEFALGDLVEVIPGELNHTPHQGTIVRIIWHHKLDCHFYYIATARRRISTRYAAADLKRITSLSGQMADP